MKKSLISLGLPGAALVGVALVAFGAQLLPSDPHTHDLVILNGRVIDPDSGMDAIRNVGIKNGSIVAISEFDLKGKKVIDATGHVVAPGFIDIHAHGQNIGDHRMQAMQGVSTVLELESGILPISDWYEDQAKRRLPLNYGASAGWTYARIAAFEGGEPKATADYFQKAQSAQDWKMKIADPGQTKRILELVEQGLDEGAIGIGINAGYAPGNGQKEYYGLSEMAAERGVATFTHVRYASNLEPESSFEAVKELIANAAVTGAHMHLCHINSTSLTDIEQIMPMVEKAKADGIPITVGAYPWGAASTVVGAAMFSGPNWRERMSSTAENFQLGTKRMTEDELTDYQKNKPGTFITWHFLDEENPESLALLDRSVAHPDVLIESDAMFWMTIDGNKIENYTGDEWLLPRNAFSHPRSNGTFAKVLRTYVRERGLLSLNEAIRKMSLMPAQTLEKFVPQMKKKGRIQIGMDADIVVFDPAVIAEKGTYLKPNQPAVGVQTLLVNGTPVVEQGQLQTAAAPGQPIRREVTKTK